jgi:hypothetical protein
MRFQLTQFFYRGREDFSSDRSKLKTVTLTNGQQRLKHIKQKQQNNVNINNTKNYELKMLC